MDDTEVATQARRLAAALEAVAGQVYFSPECHEAYARLGFGPSPRTTANGVHLPDGPAYFTSRGSAMGQVAGEVVASASAVFNPAVVVPCVDLGWSLTDAATIAAARTDGATAQLVRILGATPDGLDEANELFARAVAPLRPEGRPLYAGVVSLGLPGDPMGDMWRRTDLLREHRGDAHTAAWTTAGFDACEIGLLTELYWGLAMGTYIRTRAWSADEITEAKDRLRARGMVDGDAFTDAGRAAREAVETATDLQLRAALDALAEDLDALITILARWSAQIRDASGYLPSGPHDLATSR